MRAHRKDRGSPLADHWLERLESQLDFEALMRGCCRAFLDLSGADRCSIMALDSDTDDLVVRWADGVRVKRRGEGLKFRVGEGLCGWVARSQKAFCSADAAREPRFMPRSGTGRSFRPIRSICCLPLVVQGQTVGVVNLSSFSSSRRFKWAGGAEGRRFLDRLARVILQIALLNEARAVTERLRRQAKATSETVAQVSHEVRTPLTLITEAAQQLLDGFGGKLLPDQERLAGIIQAQGDRMLKLVTELLDLSRIEAGRLSLRREPVDLAQVVTDVRGRYGMLVSPRRLEVELDSVPPVYGDPIRLTQVAENLLTNAVKFTPPEGSITFRLIARGHSAELSVMDSGMGIPPRERQRLFQKFSQLKTPAGMGARGTGLGLAIVKEIVQLHGGAVRVDSKAGKGASFTVSLPVYSPTFALTEEFRMLREQAAREGRILAFQLIRRQGAPMDSLARLRKLLGEHVSREDRVLENPAGGVAVLSVLDAQGFQAMRRRLEDLLRQHPERRPAGGLSWGWALVPKEETSLHGVLELAEKRLLGHEPLKVAI